MIYIGYPGVGKSTLAGKNKYIDLESSCFKVNGTKPENWFIIYCNIAIDLSKQGFKVFVSSHKEVRDYLSMCYTEDIYTITPDTSLKDEWVKKLLLRSHQTKLFKDIMASKRAEERYVDDILDILNTPFNHIIIEDMEYDLEDILF